MDAANVGITFTSELGGLHFWTGRGATVQLGPCLRPSLGQHADVTRGRKLH